MNLRTTSLVLLLASVLGLGVGGAGQQQRAAYAQSEEFRIDEITERVCIEGSSIGRDGWERIIFFTTVSPVETVSGFGFWHVSNLLNGEVQEVNGNGGDNEDEQLYFGVVDIPPGTHEIGMLLEPFGTDNGEFDAPEQEHLATMEVTNECTPVEGGPTEGDFTISPDDLNNPQPAECIPDSDAHVRISVRLDDDVFTKQVIATLLMDGQRSGESTQIEPGQHQFLSVFGVIENTSPGQEHQISVLLEPTDGSESVESNTIPFTNPCEPADEVPPVIDVPDDITVEAARGETSTVVEFEVTAEDGVDGPVDVTCNPESGSAFTVGEESSVECTATDAAGNTATETFLVIVNKPPPLNQAYPDQGTCIQAAADPDAGFTKADCKAAFKKPPKPTAGATTRDEAAAALAQEEQQQADEEVVDEEVNDEAAQQEETDAGVGEEANDDADTSGVEDTTEEEEQQEQEPDESEQQVEEEVNNGKKNK